MVWKYKFYQLDIDTDSGNRKMFLSYERTLERYGFTMEDYELVYEGTIERERGYTFPTLDTLYVWFNALREEHVPDYRGRSMSVSDVVELIPEGQEQGLFYFCDSIGWKEVPGNG